MTHVISDLLFSNKNYAQKATSTVQACFIKKTDKRARISKIQSKIFLAHWYAFKLPAKTTLQNFPDGGSKSFYNTTLNGTFANFCWFVLQFRNSDSDIIQFRSNSEFCQYATNVDK